VLVAAIKITVKIT